MCKGGDGEGAGVVCGAEPKEALPTPAFSYISAGREHGSENRLLITAGVPNLWATDLLGIHTAGSERQGSKASSGSLAPHRSHYLLSAIPLPPLFSMKLVPGAKKVGDLCITGFTWTVQALPALSAHDKAALPPRAAGKTETERHFTWVGLRAGASLLSRLGSRQPELPGGWDSPLEGKDKSCSFSRLPLHYHGPDLCVLRGLS